MEIHKSIVLDEDHRPIAVQIPIEEFPKVGRGHRELWPGKADGRGIGR